MSSMCFLFLGCSFEPSPNSHVFGTSDSVITIILSMNECSRLVTGLSLRFQALRKCNNQAEFKQLGITRSSVLQHDPFAAVVMKIKMVSFCLMNFCLLQSLFESIKNEQFKIPEDDGNDITRTFFNPDREGWLTKEGKI